ncbi:hypothetical protein CKQ79_29995, partial [Klebsiella pneumoniae]
WRMILRLKVKDPKKTTEMRAALVNGDDTLSETWSYQLANDPAFEGERSEENDGNARSAG